MDDYTTRLLPAGSEPARRIRRLWLEYEEGQSKEAKFVKDLVSSFPGRLSGAASARNGADM